MSPASYGTEGHSGIVSVEEMQKYLNNTYPDSPAKTENIIAVLAGTQSQLEMYLNRPVEPVQVRELVQTDVVGRAFLSVAPVQSIASVETAGVSYPVFGQSTPYYPPVFTRGNTYRSVDNIPSALGYVVIPGGVTIGPACVWYEVDYIGGYVGYSDTAMKLAIMRVAAREIIPQHSDVLNTATGDVTSVHQADTRLKGWTEDELKQFKRHRRIVMVNAGGYDQPAYNWWS